MSVIEHTHQDSDAGSLASAFASLSTSDDVFRFLKDLTTPAELQALSERWRVARLLSEGGRSYREISQETGVSTTTVTRVARFLTQENFKGYQRALELTQRDEK